VLLLTVKVGVVVLLELGRADAGGVEGHARQRSNHARDEFLFLSRRVDGRRRVLALAVFASLRRCCDQRAGGQGNRGESEGRGAN